MEENGLSTELSTEDTSATLQRDPCTVVVMSRLVNMSSDVM